MPAEFDIEALKAQSVIARTYALKSIANGKTLTDNESTQSYKSDDELKELWGSSYNKYMTKITNNMRTPTSFSHSKNILILVKNRFICFSYSMT